ncbi:hypothetical protein PENTCL1PPCAC_22560, partial [Pristionchus entomophagus]
TMLDFSRIVLDHVDRASTRLYFNERSEDDGTALEFLCIRFQEMLSEMDEQEQKFTLTKMIEDLMSEESSKRQILEKTIDRIVEEAHHASVISPLLMMVCQLGTCDFTLKHSFDSGKLCKMKSDLDLLNYKGVRTFFKQLYEKMTAVPQEISPEQREMLTPVQELLLHIMKRDSNVIPALFVATEINNMTRQRALMFSRVMETATHMENTFRPLAELSYVTARSYLFPIPAHPSFITTSRLWKLDSTCIIMAHRLHLPFRIELYTPQTYALQMVIKQQKNRDWIQFQHMIKTGSRESGNMGLDNIVLYLIGNTMLYMERFPSQSENVASMWNHITSVLDTLITTRWCDFSRFLSVLAKTIQKSEYRKARDEVMWILLQNIKNLKTGDSTYKDSIQAIASIYSYLYEKEESSVMSSDCPLKMVRSLSAACIWIDLSGGSESLPPPSPFLARQIEFITKRNPTESPTNAMLAVIVNAYINHPTRSDWKHAIDSLLARLTSEPFFLLNEHRTFSHFHPFEYELLTALGLEGQKKMLEQLLKEMKANFLANPETILPSPALIETAARLACMSENEKSVGSIFARIIDEAAKDQRFHTPRFLFIIIELMSFRCFNQQSSRANVIIAAFQMLLQASRDMSMDDKMHNPALILQSYVRTQYDLYSALELLVLRLCTWLPPSDSIIFICKTVMNQLAHTKSHVLVDGTPPAPYSILSFPHDLAKALFVSYLRSCRLLGQEVPPELLKRINQCYYWSKSQTRYFNDKLEPNPPNFEEQESKAFEDYVSYVHSDCIQMRGLPEQSWPEYFKEVPPEHPVTLLSAHFRIIYEQARATTPQERAAILQTLSRMDVPHQITAINSFVDYLVQEAKKMNVEHFAAASCNNLAGLVIVDEIIPIDRFFFTAAFTARSDESTLAVLALIRSMVRHGAYIEMTQQLMTLPKMGSSDFIKKMNELKTRRRTSHSQQHRIHDLHPSYYGHPLLKIISSVDTLIERALQLNIPDEHFKELMDAFSPLYRFHPYPMTYCLSVMNPLYGHTDPKDAMKEMEQRQQILKMRPRARMIVLSIVKYDAGQCPFSPQFVSPNQTTTEEDAMSVALTLTNNLVATFNIGHCPDDSLSPDPRCASSFYTGDWRSSELSPQGHALYSIACEMLASPLRNEILGRAFIDILYQEDIAQPLLYLNAVSLILTTLPYTYTNFLFEEIMSLFGEPIEHLSIDQIIMETYEKTVNRKRATKVHTVIALSQAFWHHATVPILISFVSRFEEELENGVKTEKDLFLALHILIPLLQRIADAKEKIHIDRCFRMVLLIYRLLQKIAVNKITKEDAICDLLYHFKYVFVGDSVKKDINEIIDSMSASLKRKLKFIVQSTEGRGNNEDHESSERKDSVI